MKIFAFAISMTLTFCLASCYSWSGLPSNQIVKNTRESSLDAPNVVDTVGAFNFSSSDYSFLDFPFEDTSNFTYGVTDYSEGFVDGGQRWGYIVNGYKQGIWTTGSREFDSLGH